MPLIEAAVENLTAARGAESAGVDRLELCDNLDDDGTTPSLEMIEAVLDHVRVPVFVLVRPRAGDFVYSMAEFDAMLRKIAKLARLNVSGIVTGALTRDGLIDRDRTRALLDAARGLPMTFHRAVDRVLDRLEALDQLVEIGIPRVLTAGGEKVASMGASRIADMVQHAGDRITVIAGGGIRANNVAELIEQTGVSEVHSRFVNEVSMRKLVNTVAGLPRRDMR